MQRHKTAAYVMQTHHSTALHLARTTVDKLVLLHTVNRQFAIV
jgi:hypothetical protein